MFPAIIITVAACLGLLFGFIGGTVASISQIKLPPKKRVVVPDLALPNGVGATITPSQGKSVDDFTQVAKELDQWRRELTEKRDQELQFDAELMKREQLLKAEREALTKDRQQLVDFQKELDSRLIKFKSGEEAKIQEIADLYKTMKPVDAVTILDEMSKGPDKDQAVKILSKMPPKVQAKIITTWLNNSSLPEDRARVAEISLSLKRVEPDDSK